MRRTKLTFAYLLIVSVLFLIATYFFGNILMVDGSGGSLYGASSLFALSFQNTVGESTFVNNDGVVTWVRFYCDNQFSNYVYAGCLALLFFNSFRMVRKIKNSSKIAFMCVRDLIYSTVAIFILINLLTYPINQDVKYLIDGEWVLSYTNAKGQLVEETSGIVSVMETGRLGSAIFVAAGGYALIIIFKLTCFLLCLRYGDWSPIEPKKQKKKKVVEKAAPKTKIVESVQETKHEEKHIFYSGPVPKNTNKIFEGLTDGAIEEPEKINGNKQQVKTTINIKNQTPKKVETKQTTTKKQQEKAASQPKETITQVVFTTEVKAKPKEEFTGLDLFENYKPDTNNPFLKSEQEPKEKVHSATFASTNSDVLKNVISSSFDSKNLFLDDHDEYYGDDNEEDSPLEDEVPDYE